MTSIQLSASDALRVVTNALLFAHKDSGRFQDEVELQVSPARLRATASDGYTTGTDYASALAPELGEVMRAYLSVDQVSGARKTKDDPEPDPGLKGHLEAMKGENCTFFVKEGFVSLESEYGSVGSYETKPDVATNHWQIMHDMINGSVVFPETIPNQIAWQPKRMQLFGRVKTVEKDPPQDNYFKPGLVLLKIGKTFRGLIAPLNRDLSIESFVRNDKDPADFFWMESDAS